MNKKLNKQELRITRPTEAFGLIGWLVANHNCPYRYDVEYRKKNRKKNKGILSLFDY